MLSVALCTYNGSKFLDQQLESILSQTKKVDEIIICDDCSTDSTVAIIERFNYAHPKIIKFYPNSRSLGPIKNFEKAISLCCGEIIFLSDQDDIWKPNKVEKTIFKFNSNPTLEAVFSDGELINEQGSPINNTLWKNLNFNFEAQNRWTTDEALTDNVYSRNIITGATLAIKKSLFLRAYPFPVYKTVWHDAWIGIHAAANKTLGWIDEPLIQYRVHSGQQVGIGNGITLNYQTKQSDLKKFLTDLRTFFSNCLLIANDIAEKYPKVNKKLIVKEASDWIRFIDLRLHLPTNIFNRSFTVLGNVMTYKNHSKFFLKPMIKDIINPCK